MAIDNENLIFTFTKMLCNSYSFVAVFKVEKMISNWQVETFTVSNYKKPRQSHGDTINYATLNNVMSKNGVIVQTGQMGKTKTIIIGRHGKPALSRKVWLSAQGYRLWWEKYDEGGLAKGQKVPRKLLNAITHTNKIISSPLARAYETALAVAGEREIDVNDIFVEAPLPPPNIPDFIKFRPKIWGFIARCTWFVGLSYGQESHDDAKLRAKEAAKTLGELADIHGSIVLFAHGWFNRMMRPYLKLLGYKVVYDGGDMHWSFRVYEKHD
jgi:broad specificity phosphatase PhoE